MQIGVDIVEIKRIEYIFGRTPGFETKMFTVVESEYCNSKKNKFQHFAARFAAREAVYKAMNGTGIHLENISVVNDESGKPSIVLTDQFKTYESKLRISLSHCDSYAIAYAVFLDED